MDIVLDNNFFKIIHRTYEKMSKYIVFRIFRVCSGVVSGILFVLTFAQHYNNNNNNMFDKFCAFTVVMRILHSHKLNWKDIYVNLYNIVIRRLL